MKQFSIFIFLLAALSGMAQQEAHFTHFMFNQQYLNPAFVGSRNTGSFTGIHRSQWIGFEGAPTSQILSFQTPVMKSRAGVGGMIRRTSIGITNDWAMTGAYSYNIRLTQKWDLRLGMHAALKYFGIEFDSPDAVTEQPNDPSLNDGEFRDKYTANVGIGMYLKFQDYFYFGLSSPFIYPNEIGFNDLSSFTAEVEQHRYLMGGGAIPVSAQFELMPNFLIKWVDNAPIGLDLNLSIRYMKKVMAGLTYRPGGNGTGESVDALLFFQFGQKFGAGLGYDLTLSDVRDYQSGSIEVMLRYDLRDEKGNLENPRYFKKK